MGFVTGVCTSQCSSPEKRKTTYYSKAIKARITLIAAYSYLGMAQTGSVVVFAIMGEMKHQQEDPRDPPGWASAIMQTTRRWLFPLDTTSPHDDPSAASSTSTSIPAPLALEKPSDDVFVSQSDTPVPEPWGTGTGDTSDLTALVARLRADNHDLKNEIRVSKENAAAKSLKQDAVISRLREAIAALRLSRDALQERNRALKDSILALREEKRVLRERLIALRSRSETLTERLRQANERTQEVRSRRDLLVTRNKEIRDQLVASREAAVERTGKLLHSLSVSRERLSALSGFWGAARRYFALFRQGLLYDEIEKSDVDLRADTYLCLLPSTVPAAIALSRKYGGRVICDCVENVEVHRHSLAPNLHPPALEMVNLGAYGALTAVDGIMTVSNAVARTLSRFGPPVRLQPNYRRFEEPSSAGDLRARVGIGPETTVLIASGNVVKGFEAVLDAIALLPAHVHLVALVKFSPESYDLQVRGYIASRGLSDRIHLIGFVPYDELASLLADADAGIITLDPDNPNHSVSLPNRVFDFTTAGLPFIVPSLSEIAAFVKEHGCGVTIGDISPEAWADGINSVLSNLPAFRLATREARDKVTWESLDEGLIEFLGSPQTVTLLGFRDLSRYQRFLRVTDSLTQRGIQVKAAFFSEDPLPLKNAEAEFYHFTDRYGRGPGLMRVPHADS